MVIELPTRDYRGYIFDLDGTLIHSMPVHYRAWDVVMREAGVPEKLDEDLFYSLGGVPTPLVAERLGRHYGLEVDGQRIAHAKEQLYFELAKGIELVEPVVQYAREIAQTRPVAIATGGAAEVAIPTIEAAGLRNLFPIVVTPADVLPGRGKPEPDMFLEAARRIDVPPTDCVVFEDAEPGFAGARAAGMDVVKVLSRTYRG